jgi:branched-chain amino acid transport system substrate-binding protein
VLKPAGLDKSVGVISAAYMKDPTDPQFSDDPDVRDYLAFMQKYFPQGDIGNVQYVTAYARAMTLVEVLRLCQGDMSRENILRQAGTLDLTLPMLLPGIRIRTVGDRPSAITQMQLQRFDGRSWERFGDLIGTEQQASAR